MRMIFKKSILGSVFLRRILLLIFATVVLAGALTAVLYVVFSKTQIQNMEVSELESDADKVAQYYILYHSGILSDYEFSRNLELTSMLTRSNLYLYITRQNKVFTDSQITEDIKDKLNSTINTVLKTEKNASATLRLTGDTMFLVVGVPIVINGNIIGVSMLSKSIKTVTAPLGVLNRTLLWSMAAIFILMLVPAYIAAVKLIKPLYQMRDAALSMASGNFDAAADENQKGEMGQLGKSLNFMAMQLKRTISALTLEKNRLRQIIDGLNEGIAAVDAQGRLTHFNPAAMRLLGHDKTVKIENRLDLFKNEQFWKEVDIAINNGTAAEKNIESDDMTINIKIWPLGNREGAVILFRDVTEATMLERMRRDYVANVSHELKTPIASIRGLSEALTDNMVKTEQDKERYYGYILHESIRLGKLIDELLELSRLQSGAVALSKSRVDMQELVSDITSRYIIKAEEAGIRLRTHIPKQIPNVYSNADRIEQVLIILLDNAVKFTGRGGEITIGIEKEESRLLVSVADTGCGIEKKDLPHVFERFFKADQSHSGHGSGLGLSIAREILRLMGEEIWAESEPGKGSKFTFSLGF